MSRPLRLIDATINSAVSVFLFVFEVGKRRNLAFDKLNFKVGWLQQTHVFNRLQMTLDMTQFKRVEEMGGKREKLDLCQLFANAITQTH